jgi:hypothetical protein
LVAGLEGLHAGWWRDAVDTAIGAREEEMPVCRYHRKFEKDKDLVVTLAHFSSKL